MGKSEKLEVRSSKIKLIKDQIRSKFQAVKFSPGEPNFNYLLEKELCG